jgi:hypothetical protein
MRALTEARRYLWLHGTATDTTVDPVELIRDLVVELEQHEIMEQHKARRARKPKARSKRR